MAGDGVPWLLADWGPVMFLHYAVEPERLQSRVPFPLDLHEGSAYVSAVMFVQDNMRMRRWPAMTGALMRWLSDHPFLNLRTYVRVGNEQGIYFLAEWIPNRLDCLMGPVVYGLPYRHARVGYETLDGGWVGRVTTRDAAFDCRCDWDAVEPPRVVGSGSRDEFLLERYTAYTMCRGVARRFRIDHRPWPVKQAHAQVVDDGLLRRGNGWFEGARIVGAHFTAGVRDVWIGSPCRCGVRPLRWPVVLTLTGVVLASVAGHGLQLPAWVTMWMLTGVLVLGFKVWMMADVRRGGERFTWTRLAGYFALWPGMDPMPFAGVGRGRAGDRTRTSVRGAMLHVVLGALMFWVGARWVVDVHPLAAGWVGMIGMVQMAHFGVARLLAEAWRRNGVPVRPLMDRPTQSVSVSEFWGRRWNVAFRDLADRLWFRPMRARFGTGVAVIGVFVISGLLHELVISVPARGGYGLLFVYFAVQGMGILVERRWLRGRTGMRRLWAWLVVAGPVCWLFHPLFVERVILPFMRAMGAMGG